MIRPFTPTDMDAVLDLWLEASNIAHAFAGTGFWEQHLDAMRHQYLPAAETWVYQDDQSNQILGFVSLHENTLPAIFVAPGAQGKGIGQQLIARAKALREQLTLNVYSKNTRSIRFYQQCGFVITADDTEPETGEAVKVMHYPAS